MEILGITGYPAMDVVSTKEAVISWLRTLPEEHEDVRSEFIFDTDDYRPKWVKMRDHVKPDSDAYSSLVYEVVVSGQYVAKNTYTSKDEAYGIAWLIAGLSGCQCSIRPAKVVDRDAYHAAKYAYDKAEQVYTSLPSLEAEWKISEAFNTRSIICGAVELAKSMMKSWQVMYAGILPKEYATIDLMKKTVSFGDKSKKIQAYVLPHLLDLATEVEAMNKNEGDSIV